MEYILEFVPGLSIKFDSLTRAIEFAEKMAVKKERHAIEMTKDEAIIDEFKWNALRESHKAQEIVTALKTLE